MTLPGEEPGGRAPSEGTPGRRALWGFLAVGAGVVVVGAFALLARRSASEEVVRRSFTSSLERGPATGTWEIDESHGSRRRQFAPDPADADRLLCPLVNDKGVLQLVSCDRRFAASRVFTGMPETLFFANYRAEGSGGADAVAGRRVRRLRFVGSRLRPPTPTRSLWVDPTTGDVLQLEDRAFDGALVHGARWVSAALDELQAVAAQGRRIERAEPGRCCSRFHKVVAAAGFPVYEPRWLPPGFERVHQALAIEVDREIHVVEENRFEISLRRLRLVHLRYSDGLALMDLLMAKTDDMKRFAKWLEKKPRQIDPSACPTSLAEGPEELLASSDALVVKRRADRCRTVLEVERLGGVSVVLVARNELPPDTYVQVIESLEQVPGSSAPPPGEKSIRDWQQPRRDAPAVVPVSDETPAPEEIPASGQK